jgi:hypothetical protein
MWIGPVFDIDGPDVIMSERNAQIIAIEVRPEFDRYSHGLQSFRQGKFAFPGSNNIVAYRRSHTHEPSTLWERQDAGSTGEFLGEHFAKCTATM